MRTAINKEDVLEVFEAFVLANCVPEADRHHATVHIAISLEGREAMVSFSTPEEETVQWIDKLVLNKQGKWVTWSKV